MFVEALQYLLTTDVGMVALLGTPAKRPDSTNGVFPTQAPDQPTMPYVVVSEVSGAPLFTTMDGDGNLSGDRWRISCYGSTYKNAKDLAKYAQIFLKKVLGPQTAGNVVIQGAYKKMEVDDSISLGRGTLFSTHIDFSFVYDILNPSLM